MSKLNVDQKTIKSLFQDKKADFLIPDYQRPYEWEQTECQTLWNDIFEFAIPDGNADNFDGDNEYFLGPIVTFENNGHKEVIDGQQRLTTLMLLLRAFYVKFGHMQDDDSLTTKKNIEQCIWKTSEFEKPDMNELKINSEVATDNDKEEFLEILRTGEVEKDEKSRYAENYSFFEECINDFQNKYPSYFAHLPMRIMNNCILLPIEADSQDTALRIFSTLNDRGKPLSDADIFKAQFYKYFSDHGKKDYFIERWKELEERCEAIFNSSSITPMDELFTRYMYYARAKKGIKSSTTEALRKFYEDGEYTILKDEETFENLEVLSKFWEDVSNQNSDRFSEPILRKLFVLDYAPNSMWTYFVSVYFMHNRSSEQDLLEETAFIEFLDKITGFIWTYAVTNPGVHALRTPVYAEMINIVNNQPVTFAEYRFDANRVRNSFGETTFTNGRPITKSMVAWWAFTKDNQKLLRSDHSYEIEHIYSKNRQKNERSLKDPNNLEALGNKALIEKHINIRAADYRFEDKKKYYIGYTNDRNQVKEGTENQELLDMAKTWDDFTEEDIIKRTGEIIDRFIDYLGEHGLTD